MVPSSFLVERDPELADATALLARAQQGAGGLLLVEGPAGIGKTTLLDAIAARAEGCRVLRGAGDELERGFAFGVARQLFERPLARDPSLRERALDGVAALAAPLVSAGVAGAARGNSPHSARHALTWVVANLSDERPLLLLIDDLQWADPASLGWLVHLVRRLEDLPVAVAAAWRVGEPGCDQEMLDRLRDLPATRIVRPAPLTAAGVADVVSWTLGEQPVEGLAELCARATGGNPFLLAELLRALPEASGATPPDVGLVRPESIARSVARRLGRLPEVAIHAAHACAVLGDGCELRHVEALAGLARAEATAGVDQLAAAGILTPGRPLRFLHPLVRAAVYDGLPDQARGQAHEDAAHLLAAEGADPTRIAVHLLMVPPARDPWTCSVLCASAETALRRGAPAEAAGLFERALAEPPAESERPRILLSLGRAELRAGRAAGARHLTSVIEESANVTERAHAAIALLNHSIFSGHKPDPRLLERCRIDLAAADRELALELTAAEVVSGYVAAASAGPAAARVIELSRGVAGETPAEKLLLAALSFVLGVSGQASADYCAGLAAQALAGGELVREWPDVMNTTAAAQILLVGDELRLAQSAIGSGLQTAREQGSEIAFALWSATDCYRGWLQGELVEAEAAGRSALAAANDLAAARTFAMAYLTLVLADRGELDEAEALVGARDSGAEKSVIDVLALRARARLRLAQARFEEASETALELGELLRSHGNAAHPGMSWRHDAAIALTATGNKPRARQLIAEQWVDTKVWNTPRLIGITLAAEGVVEGGDRGIDLLRHAVDTLEGTPARLAYAEALLELGAMLRRKKQRSEARGVLRRALDIADRAGAGLITARAAEEIAATGARPRRIRLTGVESLTPSELRVARMAAGGMANREIAQALFVTHKTVESQLGAVYRKLDVASRSKLQEALAGG